MITYHNSLLEYTGGESFFDEIFGGLENKEPCGCPLSGDDTDSIDLMQSNYVIDEDDLSDDSSGKHGGGSEAESIDEQFKSEFINYGGDSDNDVDDNDKSSPLFDDADNAINDIFGGDDESIEASPFIETEEEKLVPSIIISSDEVEIDSVSPFIESTADTSAADMSATVDAVDTSAAVDIGVVQDIVGGMLNLF